VLVDSVQSQANRLEEALLSAVRELVIDLPYLTVDFAGKELAGIGEITSFDAPHRVYDAILRDSLLDGEPFMKAISACAWPRRSRMLVAIVKRSQQLALQKQTFKPRDGRQAAARTAEPHRSSRSRNSAWLSTIRMYAMLR